MPIQNPIVSPVSGGDLSLKSRLSYLASGQVVVFFSFSFSFSFRFRFVSFRFESINPTVMDMYHSSNEEFLDEEDDTRKA